MSSSNDDTEQLHLSAGTDSLLDQAERLSDNIDQYAAQEYEDYQHGLQRLAAAKGHLHKTIRALDVLRLSRRREIDEESGYGATINEHGRIED